MQNPREIAGDQDGITSTVSGGLDTTSSRLSMPAERSPNLLNMEILRDGSVAKRKGFRRELTFTSFSNEYPNGFFSFGLLSGLPIVLSTVNGALMSAFFPDDNYSNQNAQPVGSVARSNVFRSADRVDFTLLREPNQVSRVVMTQKDTCPIQISFVEGVADYEFDSTGGVFAISVVGKVFEWATPTYAASPYFVIYTSGIPWVASRQVRYDAALNKLFISALSCTDITGAGINLANVNLSVVYHTVQYWTEALKVEGFQIVANAVRGTTSPQDRAVAVPSGLLNNIESIGTEAVFPGYPLRVSPDQGWLSTYTFTNPPTTAAQYCFTNNGATLSTGGNRFIRSPNWIVFGGVPATPETFLFSRGFSIPFVGDTLDYVATTQPKVFEVYGNDASRPAWRSWGDNTAGLLAQDYSWVRRTPAYADAGLAGNWKYVTFDGGVMSRVSLSSQFLITSPFPNSNTGAYFPALSSEINRYVEASGWATFGISSFSNYRTHSHPSVSALWQSRLVFAGWKDDPLRVAVSGVEDDAIAGLFWNNFQSDYALGRATDPYDFVLPSQNDDYITAIREYQGSLFIFTRDRLFRLVSDNGSPVIRLVSNVGAGNASCVSDMEGTIVFMGSQGLFAIEATRDSLDYTTRELSENIRSSFDEHSTQYGWIAYSSQQSYLFCAFGDYLDTWRLVNPGVARPLYRFNVPTQLYVYNQQYAAWSKWSDQSGSTFETCGGCAVRRSDRTTTVAIARALRGDPARQTSQWNDWCLWEWGINTRYSDTYVYPVGSPLLSSFVLCPTMGAKVQLATGETEYFLDRSGTRQQPSDRLGLLGGFGYCPVRDIQDIEIFTTPPSGQPSVLGTPLIFGIDYYKTNHNSLVFTTDYAQQNNVTILYGRKNPAGGWQIPWSCYVDDVPTVVAVTPDLGYYRMNIPAFTNRLEFCEQYPSWYSSPHWYRAGVGYKKRATTYVGYYNNQFAGGLYNRNNLNQNPVQFIGDSRSIAQFGFALTFSDEDEGYYDNECYSSSELTWDYSSLDMANSSAQFRDYARIMLPVFGAGYNFQVWNYAFSETTFRLVGYEVRTKAKRGRGINNTTD